MVESKEEIDITLKNSSSEDQIEPKIENVSKEEQANEEETIVENNIESVTEATDQTVVETKEESVAETKEEPVAEANEESEIKNELKQEDSIKDEVSVEKKQEVSCDSTEASKVVEEKTNDTQFDKINAESLQSHQIQNTPAQLPPVNTFKTIQQPQQQTPKNPVAMFQGVSRPNPVMTRPAAGRTGANGNQTEASKIKETILNWCIEKTKEYPNVQIANFSSSWSNGMAFCALIHHFCPDTFDFNRLDPKNRKGNFELAFRVAEDKCDISPLLEADDMVLMGNKPDSRCVFTYLSTMYQKLELLPQAKAAALAKKNEA